MAERVAKTTKYYTADKARLVDEGDPEGVYLFVRAGSPIPTAEAERLNYTEADEVQAYNARADHALKHGGDTVAAADAKRARMFEGIPDPDGPPAEGERGDLEEKAADAARATKAVEKPPANKAARG